MKILNFEETKNISGGGGLWYCVKKWISELGAMREVGK